MRVLHIDTGREMRGGQWQVLYLLEGLAAAGHTGTLVAPAGSPLYAACRAKGFDVRPLGRAAVSRLSRAADLAHAHDARAHTLAALLARSPVLVARRVAFPVQRNLLSRWKYGRAAHFIAVSNHVRETLIAADIHPARVSVVYDGVPAGAVARAGSRIVAPYTSDPAKGMALVEKAAELAQVKVHFSPDLAGDLDGAGMFVYITLQEGLGSGALLAMAHGVPVIASRIGGLPEVVEDGQTGLLTGNTPEEIAGAIRRLLADRALAERLGASGRRQVEERFSVDIMVRNTLAVYGRVLSC